MADIGDICDVIIEVGVDDVGITWYGNDETPGDGGCLADDGGGEPRSLSVVGTVALEWAVGWETCW